LELKIGDTRLRVAMLTVAIVGTLLTAGAGLWANGRAGLSIGIGAMVALSNLYVLSRIVATLAVPHEGEPHVGLTWGVIVTGKIMVLFGGLWLLMTRHLVDPIPLVVGYGALPIGIAIGAVVSDKTDRRTGV
jgi:hypothetical protein